LIAASRISFVEVLVGKLTDEQGALFGRNFKTHRHSAGDVDVAVAMKARDFRTAIVGDPKSHGKWDAICLATASIYRAEEFWTSLGDQAALISKL
jgi:hypothetical protein